MNMLALFAKLSLDSEDFENGVDKAKKKAKKFASALGSAFVASSKAIVTGIGAASAGIATITAMSVKKFAEYEQLVGGAELMFGSAYATVAQNAKEAYATVQLSQSEYLQQVNGFATGLKTALGGNEQAAADLAHNIIKAEADVVAATGNSQEAVQNAFNGIMKSNYMMLDNLSLGITPTKEGFQEVIDKVNEWNAANGEATDYQIDNLADSQAALVDYIEMQGLAGYAAEEAAGTIEGSLAMVSASWENLVTGFSDDQADMDQLISDFTDSVGIAFENLLPVVLQSLSNISIMVDELFPVIMAQLPTIISETLPTIVTSAAGIITSLVTGLTENKDQLAATTLEVIGILIQTVVDLLPDIIDLGFSLLISFINGVAEDPQAVIDTAIDLVLNLVTGIAEGLPDLILAVGGLVASFIAEIVTKWPDIVDAGEDILTQLAQGIDDSLQAVWDAGVAIVDEIIAGIESAWEGLKSWFTGIWDDLFGNNTVSVDVQGAPASAGSRYYLHASGLDYVPYDLYPARLHEGEMVLTAEEADEYRSRSSGVTVVQNIYSEAKSAADLMDEALYYQERAVIMRV